MMNEDSMEASESSLDSNDEYDPDYDDISETSTNVTTSSNIQSDITSNALPVNIIMNPKPMYSNTNFLESPMMPSPISLNMDKKIQ